MKQAFASRRAIAGYAAAAIIGFALGSYQYLASVAAGVSEDAPASASRTIDASPSRSPARAMPDARDGASGSSEHGEDSEAGAQRRSDPMDLVFASQGLVLRPALMDGEFIGFLVVQSDANRRFSVGDIIVSVNGQAVENSAAGSELLIASLVNPDVPVEIHSEKIE